MGMEVFSSVSYCFVLWLNRGVVKTTSSCFVEVPRDLEGKVWGLGCRVQGVGFRI